MIYMDIGHWDIDIWVNFLWKKKKKGEATKCILSWGNFQNPNVPMSRCRNVAHHADAGRSAGRSVGRSVGRLALDESCRTSRTSRTLGDIGPMSSVRSVLRQNHSPTEPRAWADRPRSPSPTDSAWLLVGCGSPTTHNMKQIK